MKVADKMAYAKSADPDQTEGAVWSGSILFAIPKVFIEHKKQNLGQNSVRGIRIFKVNTATSK